MGNDPRSTSTGLLGRLLTWLNGPTTALATPEREVLQHALLPEYIPLVDSSGANATIAFRALLKAFGLKHDAAAIDRECGVRPDGSVSLDDLEVAARARGLDAEQTVQPLEHLLGPEAQLLPAIAVVHDDLQAKQFFLLWNLRDGRVQVLDARGSCWWLPPVELLARLYVHEMEVDRRDAAAYLHTEAFLAPLRCRLLERGLSPAVVDSLIGAAEGDPGWRRIATLDALERTRRGDAASLERAIRDAFLHPDPTRAPDLRLPHEAWTLRLQHDARTAPPTGIGVRREDQLTLRGCVLLTVRSDAPR